MKHNIPRPGILDSTPGYPLGYITEDEKWAAIPLSGTKKYVIINNGQQVHVAKNYPSAKAYILREKKKSK